MFTKTLATATASALLAGGAVAYTSTAATTKPAAKPPVTQGQRYAARQEKLTKHQAALAQRLGVSTDQLKAANDALLKRSLDTRVAAGNLTVAQRSAILACKAAPLTCDRTNLPVRAKKNQAKAKKHAAKRLDRRATNLAAQLHLDKAKVEAVLKG